ncbi:MAG TPA: hypothetical protein VMS22_02870 [Candidatus Eisenbacteria bacterium]|nr:hypothetical protein [Candidatus Eisenbacteria bacterium]
MTGGIASPTIGRARLVWGALLVSLVMYVVVLVLLLGQPGTPAPTDATMMRYLFIGLTVANLGVVLVFRRNLPPSDAGPATAAPDPQAVFTTYLVCWSLSEAVALYGLVLGFLTHGLDAAQPFFIVGAALLLWQRPRAEHFAERA